jgi:predicted phosphoribosyltransferase
VVAVPTAPASTCQRLRGEADEVVCATTPRPFRAVGYSYRSFPQTSDEEVSNLLRSAWAATPGDGGPGPDGPGPAGPRT